MCSQVHSTPQDESGNVSSETIAAVLEYLNTLRWPVFPVCSPRDGGGCNEHGIGCEKPGKVPLVKWGAFQSRLPTEVEVRAWWRLWPQANIGLATGKLSGVVVIDLDGHVAQQEAAKRGYLDGPWAKTGREGGVHRYFAYRDDAPRNFVKRGGIDYRGEGGYVVLPRSQHVDGPRYEWGQAPVGDQVYPPLEAWVNEFAHGKPAQEDFAEPAFEPIDEGWLLEHGVPEGMRDDVLFRVAAKCRGNNASLEDAYDLVQRIARVCQPPFPEREARAKVDSAYRRYSPNPEPIRIHLNGAAVQTNVDEDDGRLLYAVPTFPDKVLPPPLLGLVKGTSLPTSLVAGAGLVTLAIAIGGETEVVRSETHQERAILWVPLIGRNGVGKSPSMNLAFDPLQKLDDKLYQRYQDELQEWLALDDKHRKQEPRPQDPRRMRSDPSGPGLIRQLNRLPDTGLRLDELSTTLRNMKAGKDGQSLLDPGQMLKLWSGEGVSYTRVGGGMKGGGNEIDLYAPRPTVSICGDIQTYLHALLGSDLDGMRPRWLPHLWEQPWKEARLSPLSDVLEGWASLVKRLSDRRLMPRRWHMERNLVRLHDRLAIDWSNRADTAEQATYQSALLKAERQVLRIALVLAECDADDVSGGLYLEQEHLERAAQWVEYCLRVWLALGDAEHLSLTREAQALDPAVERVRIYIEQQGLIDSSTGRRYTTAKLLLNHGVAGIKDVGTRDRAILRYQAFYPGCVEERTPPTGGPKTILLWAPKRRPNDPSNDLIHPSNDPEPPVERPNSPVERPDLPVERPVEIPEAPRLRARARTRPPSDALLDAESKAADEGKRVARERARARKEQERLDAADAAAPDIQYLVVLEDGELLEALSMLSTELVGLDTETTGLSAKRDRLRTVNLSDGETHVVIDTWGVTNLRPLQAYLNEVREVAMHTYLFDFAFLAQRGIKIDAAKVLDVRTAAVLAESSQLHTDFSLQGIARRWLQHHVAKAEQKSGWDVATLRHAKLAYAAEDARVTHALALEVRSERRLRIGPSASVARLERDVQAATWWLASAGAPADAAVMAQAVEQQRDATQQALDTLNDLAGTRSINWRSPVVQVKPLLRQRGLDVKATSENALMNVVQDDPIVGALLDYRSAQANLNLVLKAQASIAPDGRIYASFNPIGAVTGRTSCSDPNLQNLPHATLARAAIRPGPGRVFVRADYSQLQIVIAAYLSRDAVIQRILNDRGDVHQRTADAVGCSRKQAKAINFGFLFGAQAATFRREQRKNGIFLTERQAQDYRDTFMRTYPGIQDWHRSQAGWDTAVDITDPSGTGRTRFQVASKNMQLNTPVQMVEAHGFKRALIDLYASRKAFPSARLVMMVHDELIAECDERDADEVKLWLVGCMHAAMQPLTPGWFVKVDALTVHDYSDAEKERAEDAERR